VIIILNRTGGNLEMLDAASQLTRPAWRACRVVMAADAPHTACIKAIFTQKRDRRGAGSHTLRPFGAMRMRGMGPLIGNGLIAPRNIGDS
jgi:hypothetical protein